MIDLKMEQDLFDGNLGVLVLFIFVLCWASLQCWGPPTLYPVILGLLCGAGLELGTLGQSHAPVFGAIFLGLDIKSF